VRGIISLAHMLGKTVVAEGIETEAQAKALTEFGCDYAQGYYYGKPADAQVLRASLRPEG
jgi:EAL domain-containing protein (putative c-di-GMP-specific phosphodiesterase class I)